VGQVKVPLDQASGGLYPIVPIELYFYTKVLYSHLV
jgi:hypothetical protein